jgi:hypothetical protein
MPHRIVWPLRVWAAGVASVMLAAQIACASSAPTVVITSREPSGGSLRVTGFLEGTDLKSAGIHDGGQMVKEIRVNDVRGQQRVNFDITIPEPPPTMTMDVMDIDGRTASAQIAPASAPSVGSDSPAPSSEGEAVSAGPPPPTASSSNTAELPSYGGSGATSSSAHRRLPTGVAGRLSGVKISILAVQPSRSQPGSYEVIGQISGAGVHRAGVYEGGRQVKPIAIEGGGYSSFDVTFPKIGEDEPTIRAYGAGNNFVEASIDTTTASTTLNAPGVMIYNGSPYSNPYGVYGNPYGGYVNPYANPYGAPRGYYNPYSNPYGGYSNPYGAPVNPYSNPYNSYPRSPGR